MAIRYSDAMIAMIIGDIGLRKSVYGSKILFFTGSQPANANSGSGSSQPIIEFTDNAGEYSSEVVPTWQFTITNLTGTASITSISLSGFEIMNGNAEATTNEDLASEVSSSINSCVSNMGFHSSVSGNVVSIYGSKSSGSRLNPFSVIVASSGTVTITYDDTAHTGAPLTDGVDAINGLSFDQEQDGEDLSPVYNGYYIKKASSQTWAGLNGYKSDGTLFTGITNDNTYSAGWGRLCISENDTGFDATSGNDGYARIDFSVGATTADCIMSPQPSFYIETSSGSEIQSIINSFILKMSK